jgi:hypothetical protein
MVIHKNFIQLRVQGSLKSKKISRKRVSIRSLNRIPDQEKDEMEPY